MAYLEIDPGYAVDASSRTQRAIALLGIENNPTLYDQQQLNGHVPKDMQKSHFSHIFGNKDKTLQVWSQYPLERDPVIRSIKVDNGTKINGSYSPPDKTLIYHNHAWWKQSEMEGRILKQWKKKLGDEQYICHIKQSRDSVKLKLSPRTDTKIARG